MSGNKFQNEPELYNLETLFDWVLIVLLKLQGVAV